MAKRTRFRSSDVCYSSRDEMVTGDQVENPWWLSASAGSNPALRSFFFGFLKLKGFLDYWLLTSEKLF